MSYETIPVLQQFNKAYFTVSKTDNFFSSQGIDQKHEQCKKIVKVDGGAIGILENKTALLKRAVVGPIISDIIDQADQDLQNPEKPPKHHEDTDLCEKNFSNARNSFLGALMEYGNPFWEEEPMLAQIVLKHVLDESATSSAKSARKIGFNQFVSFINYRLQNGAVFLYGNITKNNLPLFDTVVKSKSKQRIANLEADCQAYVDFFVTCQARDGDLDNVFAHENHAYPVSVRIWEIKVEFYKIRFFTVLERYCKAESIATQCAG